MEIIHLRGLADLDKTLGWGEDAQAEGQQDPSSVEAAAHNVLLKLLADLTVDLISVEQLKLTQ